MKSLSEMSYRIGAVDYYSHEHESMKKNLAYNVFYKLNVPLVNMVPTWSLDLFNCFHRLGRRLEFITKFTFKLQRNMFYADDEEENIPRSIHYQSENEAEPYESDYDVYCSYIDFDYIYGLRMESIGQHNMMQKWLCEQELYYDRRRNLQ